MLAPAPFILRTQTLSLQELPPWQDVRLHVLVNKRLAKILEGFKQKLLRARFSFGPRVRDKNAQVCTYMLPHALSPNHSTVSPVVKIYRHAIFGSQGLMLWNRQAAGVHCASWLDVPGLFIVGTSICAKLSVDFLIPETETTNPSPLTLSCEQALNSQGRPPRNLRSSLGRKRLGCGIS